MLKRLPKSLFALLMLTLFSVSANAAPEFVNEVTGSTATLTSSSGSINSSVGMFDTPSFEFTAGNTLAMELPQDYTQFTLACWFRWSNATGNNYPTLFSSLDNSAGWGGTYFHLKDGTTATFRVNPVQTTTNHGFPATSPSQNNWHHLVYMRDNNMHYFFVDGVLQGTMTEANPNSCKTWYFGGLKKGTSTDSGFTSGCYMTGFVDEIAVWTGLRYGTSGFQAPTAEYDASTESNLVALFHVNSQRINQRIVDTIEHNDVYGSWQNGKWWQEVGYAGVGNQNEVLTVTELDLVPPMAYTQATTIYDPTITVNNASEFNFRVSYALLGKAICPKYVKNLKLWARPYDPTYESVQVSKVDNTFAYPFDQRDPVGKSGAILLGQAAVPESGIVTFDVSLMPTQTRYVLYLTADIADDLDKVSDKDIPFLQSSTKTELGANLLALVYDGTMDFAYSYKTSSSATPTTGTKTNYVFSNEEVDIFQAANSRQGAAGSRVLVPEYHVLYAPNDFYSKYYRIPAIARAADGSIVAISDARKYHIHDITNDIDMLARRSTDGGSTWTDPVTIAKGTGFNESTGSCTSAMGYGDAAIATLPNGNIIVTMIWGYSLDDKNASHYTRNYYCLSRDNGQSWSAPKEIPLELTRDKNSTQNERGCVAPGNMCVVKEGPLAGKVLACWRSYKKFGSSGADCQYSYILCYDPDTDSWSTMTLSVSGNDLPRIRISSSYAEDEAHLVEVGTNKFLYSVRANANAGNRAFCLFTYNEATKKLVYSAVSDNMETETPCNGDIMRYVADGQTYILHTLPSKLTDSARSHLKFYYTTDTGESGSVSWTKSVNISDPYDDDYRKETGQYSSITTLDDGSIFVLFEEYPQIIRVENDRGDYMMHSALIKLRIGDIISGAEPKEVIPLKAPTISPENQTYDCSDFSARPEIIITNTNTDVPFVTTHYEITVYAQDGSKIGTITGYFDFEDEKTIHWTEIANETFTVGGERKTLEQIVYNGGYNSGVHISVSAYCTSSDSGYEVSPRAQTDYVFGNPIIPLRIVTREQTGWGDPYMQAQYLGNFYQNEVMRVAYGSDVKIVANDKSPYNFVGFSFDSYNYTPLTTQEINDFQIQQISPNQINIIVPNLNSGSSYFGPDNVVNIYAWYETTLYGLKTRVCTNQYEIVEGEEVYPSTDWSRPGDEGDFPAPSANLTFSDVIQPTNASKDILPYNFVLKPGSTTKYSSVDAIAMIMPDSRAMKYNAVVIATRKEVPPTGVRAAAPTNGVEPISGTNYILIQGTKTPLSDALKAEDGSNVVQWYTEVDGIKMPALIDNLVFPAMVPEQSTDTPQSPDFDVKYYVIDGDITSLTNLESNPGFKTLISHDASRDESFTPDGSKVTAIETIDYSSREVRSVLYYNLTGTMSLQPYDGINIVVTTFSDGTRLVEKVLKK